MDDIHAQIGEVTKDLREHMDATKKRFNVLDQVSAERDDRWKQARDDMATNNAEVKALAARLEELSKRDHVNRSVRLVDDLDYTTRSLTNVVKRLDDPGKSRHLYERFLCSRPRNDTIQEYHALSTKLSLLRAVMRKRDPNYSPGRSRCPEVMLMWDGYRTLQNDLFGDEFFERAFDTTESSEWVPELLGSDLIRYLEVYGNLIPNLVTFPMPVAVYRLPITTSAAKASRFVEVATHQTGAFNYSTSPLYADAAYPADRVTWDAERIRGFMVITDDFTEESVVPALEFSAIEVADSVRRAIEDACINGDAASPGFGDVDLSFAVGADGSASNRTLWNGFRALIAANSATQTAASGVFTIANAVDTMSLMTRYAVQGPDQLLWICGIKSYLDLLDTGELLTVDKYGSRAVVVTGAVGNLLGTGVIISEFVREDLNVSGVYDSTTTNNTEAILIHRPSWRLGNFRGITTERERLAGVAQNVVYAWWRGDFQKTRAAAQKTEAALVDLTAA